MNTLNHDQRTITKFQQDTHILTWIEAFLIDRKARGLSSGTINFYNKKLNLFIDWCDTQLISDINQLTAPQLRLFIIHLEDMGHNPGGVHAVYRTLRTFLYWWEEELEPEGWKNPIRKVKVANNRIDPLKPIETHTIKKLLDVCSRKSFADVRDRAIILALLDTGARAQEFLDIDLEDTDLITGAILIKQGKGAKPRMVFLGRKSRRAIRSYLKLRQDCNPALWIGKHGERLTYDGLRSIIRRRSDMADVRMPALHAFRRTFALTMLRNHVDIFSLQRLMGHADLQVLRRYLAQNDEDSREAHVKGSPVDNLSILE